LPIRIFSYLSSGLRAGDAVNAATAVENNPTPFSSKGKNFKPTKDLKLKVYNPAHTR